MNQEDEEFNRIERESKLRMDLIRDVKNRNKAMDKEYVRPWVGLTDEEIEDCFKITPDQHLPWHIYQRIEAKLKEKNT